MISDKRVMIVLGYIAAIVTLILILVATGHGS